jgi:hypothetical protein
MNIYRAFLGLCRSTGSELFVCFCCHLERYAALRVMHALCSMIDSGLQWLQVGQDVLESQIVHPFQMSFVKVKLVHCRLLCAKSWM